jgi:hypothetical protein
MSDDTLQALLLGGFGLLILAIAAASLREAAAMKRWPVARGRVLSSRVEESRDTVSAGTHAAATRLTRYRPVVVYEYEAGGSRFRGDRIAQSPGMDRGVSEIAESVVRRYASGSAVDVRYNPARPAESVLEPRVPGSWKFAVALALGLLALAARAYVR